MENKEIIKKYAITKKMAITLMFQVVLIGLAFCLSVFGIYKNIGLKGSTNRIIIYSGQSLACLAIIIFGLVYFNKRETKYFRSVIISYGLLEAIRVPLLQIVGILIASTMTLFIKGRLEQKEFEKKK